MVDKLFAEPDLAEWYDLFCPWNARDDFPFYLPFIMAAESVLDVGCGTGMLLHRARESGHPGRLCGLDPAPAMLNLARRRSDIEWADGDLSTVSWTDEFDLVIMTGHAFQTLTTDAEVRSGLAAIHTALKPHGTFAFETRNPLVREWETWTPENAVEVRNSSGTTMRQTQHVESFEDDLLTFILTYTTPSWPEPKVSRSTLRFLDVASLSAFLEAAGFTIEDQFGDFSRTPVSSTSPEIVTFASAPKISPPLG